MVGGTFDRAGGAFDRTGVAAGGIDGSHKTGAHIWKGCHCKRNSFSSDRTSGASGKTGVAVGGLGDSHKTAMRLEGLPIHTEKHLIIMDMYSIQTTLSPLYIEQNAEVIS